MLGCGRWDAGSVACRRYLERFREKDLHTIGDRFLGKGVVDLRAVLHMLKSASGINRRQWVLSYWAAISFCAPSSMARCRDLSLSIAVVICS